MSAIDIYRERGRELNARDSENKFAIGDWQIAAERALGDTYYQVVAEVFTISEERLKTYRRVAEAFPPSERVHELSWQHHHVVNRRDLDPTTRRALLAAAVANGWSSRELTEHAKEASNVEAVLRPFKDLSTAMEGWDKVKAKWPSEHRGVWFRLCQGEVEEECNVASL